MTHKMRLLLGAMVLLFAGLVVPVATATDAEAACGVTKKQRWSRDYMMPYNTGAGSYTAHYRGSTVVTYRHCKSPSRIKVLKFRYCVTLMSPTDHPTVVWFTWNPFVFAGDGSLNRAYPRTSLWHGQTWTQGQKKCRTDETENRYFINMKYTPGWTLTAHVAHGSRTNGHITWWQNFSYKYDGRYHRYFKPWADLG